MRSPALLNRAGEHMQGLLTIGFTSHRIEIIPFISDLIKTHDLVIIEEAPNQKFVEMLRKDISIGEYISEAYMDFPIFCRHFYRILMEYRQRGKEILQVDPYMERLFQIYEMFSKGREPMDVINTPALKSVYEVESKASGVLIDFYESTLIKPFHKVVDAVKRFARADAERFRLRDEMRAEAIKDILPKGKRVFIEAGAIHLYLEKCLRDILGDEYLIESKSLLEPLVMELTGQRQAAAPGDTLTLCHIFGREMEEGLEDLLAARSLIYIKIVEKKEMMPIATEQFPHLRDEINAIGLAGNLTLSQCEELYYRIRFKDRMEALRIVDSCLRH